MHEVKTRLNYSEENLYKCFYENKFINAINFSYYKKNFAVSLLFLILFFIAVFFSKRQGDYWLSAMLLLPSVISLFSFTEYLWRCFKWKKSVDVYVNELLAFKYVELIINENGCGLKTDEEYNFQYWNSVSNFSVTNNFIRINYNSGLYILIPANATDDSIRHQIITMLTNRQDVPNEITEI